MKRFSGNQNTCFTTSTANGVFSSCAHIVMDTMILVSIIIMRLGGVAVILAAILAVVSMEEKVKAPRARACA